MCVSIMNKIENPRSQSIKTSLNDRAEFINVGNRKGGALYHGVTTALRWRNCTQLWEDGESLLSTSSRTHFRNDHAHLAVLSV